MKPAEEHAALTEALRSRQGSTHYGATARAYLAVLDVLIEELPKHHPEVNASPAWCDKCYSSRWTDCPIVRAARAAVGQP